ncbi:MAG: VacB/RNase II family 3'-5' exoribonuclease [Candidatus Acidiferrales bacterium]
MKIERPEKPEKNERPPEVNAQDVVAHLGKAKRPLSIREMAHEMGLHHHGRRALPKILAKLKRRGEVDEIYGGRYRLSEENRPRSAAKSGAHKSDDRKSPTQKTEGPKPTGSGAPRQAARDPNLIAGRFIAHRDGYGFVVPAEPQPKLEGDLFIGRDGVGDAMHGDRVLARIARRRADGRAEGPIVQILEREHPTVVGLFRYGPHSNVVLPYDTRILHEIVIAPGDELTPELKEKLAQMLSASGSPRHRVHFAELDGAVVNVELTRFPKGGLAPAGRVIEIVGRPGDIGVDTEIIIRKHHLPYIFPDEVIAEARAVPQQVGDMDRRGRRDFRELPIVTIDGETARDFDDAVHVASLPNGHFELQVHIADVAHYVRRGSPLDLEARLRGTSVYFPKRAVPMLPEELSNGICSLNPQVDRLVMSVIMEIDVEGKITGVELTPGVIRSAERMTYTNVNKVLEGDAEASLRYESLVGHFRRMRDLALILNKRRHDRGSIDFDLPEPILEFDDESRVTGIVRNERNIAHRIIEEFMLAANETVARYLERRGIASLHRVHEKPDPKKVLEFEELAKTFGYSLGVTDLFERRITVRHGKSQPPSRRDQPGHGRMRQMAVTLPASDEVDIRPEHYQRLTEKIAGKPEERILSYLMLRSLRQARYAAEALGHFALAAGEYTHFTSPIRRYPDLIVHRVLKWALENPDASAPRATVAVKSRAHDKSQDESLPSIGPYRRQELEKIAAESSEAERRADGAERELMDWKTAQYMESHLGEEYDALVISVQKFGFFVELLDVFIEGLVGIDRIEEFTGGRCMYREQEHAIVCEPERRQKGRGRTAERVFHLGDRVRVRAERIDPFRQRVEFALIE